MSAETSGIALGARGALRADGDKCVSCGLPLAASPILERLEGRLVSPEGIVTHGEAVFLLGVCVCGAGWGRVWSVG